MTEEVKLNHKSCPKCGNTVDMDSRFCKHCAFDLTKSESTQASFSAMSSQQRICSNCGVVVSANATLCNNCGRSVGGYQYSVGTGSGKQSQRILVAICVLVGIVGIVALLLSLRSGSESHSSSTAVGNSYSANSSRTTPASSGTESDSGKLTNAKVENAVNKLTGNLRVGGSITVEGIQEQPQQNQATADLRFNGFQYKSDMAGTPLNKDRQAPKKPDINDRNFYDEMYKYGTQQVQTRTYSGRGTGILKRYNDGRWVLKEVHWEFNGWAGTVDVQ